jgi:putative DNA primase/helicase
MISAEAMAGALGGRKTGAIWMARCPAHDDRNPSLSIAIGKNGKTLVRCHAGCEQIQVIDALKTLGLWNSEDENNSRRLTRNSPPAPNLVRERDDAQRSKSALRIWQASFPAPSTPVETYLRSRGLLLKPPSTLRFHAGLRHPSGHVWPALVALVTRGSDDTPLAIHRTFLARNGSGKAPVDSQKMMLGPCRGGVVRLGSPKELLMVGEGIETCLAAIQATGRSAWAALSTSGLRTLNLPDDVRDVIILADGDEPGQAAARDAALGWKHEDRRVRIANPGKGIDFNDLLLGRVSPHKEIAT